jgi:hypothetical protein
MYCQTERRGQIFTFDIIKEEKECELNGTVLFILLFILLVMGLALLYYTLPLPASPYKGEE